jgi:hypothetical protein
MDLRFWKYFQHKVPQKSITEAPPVSKTLNLIQYATKPDLELRLWLALCLLKNDPIEELKKALIDYTEKQKPTSVELETYCAYCNELVRSLETPKDLLFQLTKLMVLSLPEPTKLEDIANLVLREQDLPEKLVEELHNFRSKCLLLNMI